MHKTKTCPAIIGVLALGLLLTACKSTLAPGPYGGGVIIVTNTTGVVTNTVSADMGLYVADGSFVAAVSALDLAFRFEKDNRATLWKISPEIKHGLDLIRPGAEQGVQAYRAARAAYVKNPTPAGLDLLTTILAKVQQAASAATAAVTSVTTTPAPK